MGSRKCFYRGKAVLHSLVCVCVCSLLDYPACNTNVLHCIVIRGLSGSNTFFHIISRTARFSERTVKHKMCFDFPYKFRQKHFSI